MENNNFIANKAQFENQLKMSANWFFTISALSMLNSIVLMFGGKFNFVVGLGVTSITGAIANELGTIGKVVIMIFNLISVGIFVGFGFLGKKGYKWAFIVGMILYAMDGLIFLLVKDWLSIGFHVYALYRIYNGIPAIDSIRKLEQEQLQAKQVFPSGAV